MSPHAVRLPEAAVGSRSTVSACDARCAVEAATWSQSPTPCGAPARPCSMPSLPGLAATTPAPRFRSGANAAKSGPRRNGVLPANRPPAPQPKYKRWVSAKKRHAGDRLITNSSNSAYSHWAARGNPRIQARRVPGLHHMSVTAKMFGRVGKHVLVEVFSSLVVRHLHMGVDRAATASMSSRTCRAASPRTATSSRWSTRPTTKTSTSSTANASGDRYPVPTNGHRHPTGINRQRRSHPRSRQPLSPAAYSQPTSSKSVRYPLRDWRREPLGQPDRRRGRFRLTRHGKDSSAGDCDLVLAPCA